MKVKELIKILKDLPLNDDVVIAQDGEGNEFSPLADYSTAMYVADSTWSGSIVAEEDIDGSDEEYKENAVVLWPTN